MSTATLETPDIRELPEWITSDTLYEIIDGEYVEKEPMSATAARLATRISRLISNHTIDALGEASCETLITLPGASRSRRPDVIYVSYETWPKGQEIKDTDGWSVLPDLCVEVVSPSDRFDAVMEKMEEYFEAGVPQVWIVTPHTKLLQVYTSPTECRGYKSGDIVDCNSIIPGFQLNLSEVL